MEADASERHWETLRRGACELNSAGGCEQGGVSANGLQTISAFSRWRREAGGPEASRPAGPHFSLQASCVNCHPVAACSLPSGEILLLLSAVLVP